MANANQFDSTQSNTQVSYSSLTDLFDLSLNTTATPEWQFNPNPNDDILKLSQNFADEITPIEFSSRTEVLQSQIDVDPQV